MTKRRFGKRSRFAVIIVAAALVAPSAWAQQGEPAPKPGKPINAGDVLSGELNATVDGQTTAHYITDLLQDANVRVTRLAHGVPVGGELDYLDEGTLSAAMRQRTLF